MKPILCRRATLWPLLATSLFAATLGIAFATPPQGDTGNLIANPGFENGRQGWPTGSLPPNADTGIDMAIDRDVKHAGAASLRFQKSQATFFPVGFVGQTVRVSGSQRKLKVGVWVKADRARKATMAVGFDGGDGSIQWGAYIGDPNGGGGSTTHEWKHYTSVLAIPSGSSEVRIMLQMYGSGTVWLDDVSARYVPAETPVKAAVEDSGGEPEEDPAADVKDVPNQDLRAGNDPMKRYFLIGKPVEGANKLLVVLPGGDGSADFNPFLRRVWKNALPPGYLIAQLVAPKWADNQANSLVWPTRKVRWTGMKFATEDFIEAVVKDVSAKAKVNPAKVFTLSWSSGGPAAYAASLANGPVKGSFVAMSIYRPDDLPPLINAGGHAYYILHSPEDFISIAMPTKAEKELKAAGAKATLVTYKGGHGWKEDPFGHIRKGVEWLEANAK